MKLTDRQGFCLMTAFLLGNVLSSIGGTSQGEKTGYLAVFLSFLLLVVLIGIYRVILKRNDNRNFFDLFGELFGKTGSKIILVLVAGYSFLSAFLSIANYMKFMNISTDYRTPEVAAFLAVLLLVWYLCISREKTMGRYAEIVLPIVLVAVAILFCCGIKEFQAEHLVPVTSPKNFLMQGVHIFLAPFSEIIFVYLLFDGLQNKKNITKIALFSCGGVVLLFSGIYLFNLLVLGQELMQTINFPTFYAASVVRVGTVIENAETLITFSYTFCDLLYSGACLFLCTKALFYLMGKKKRAKKITAACAVILIFIFLQIFKETAAIEQFYPIATFVMIPFTIGLPLIMLLATVIKKSNIKAHSQKSCNNGEQKL